MKNPALKNIPKQIEQKIRTTIYITKQTRVAMKKFIVEYQEEVSDYSGSQYIEELIINDLKKRGQVA